MVFAYVFVYSAGHARQRHKAEVIKVANREIPNAKFSLVPPEVWAIHCAISKTNS